MLPFKQYIQNGLKALCLRIRAIFAFQSHNNSAIITSICKLMQQISMQGFRIQFKYLIGVDIPNLGMLVNPARCSIFSELFLLPYLATDGIANASELTRLNVRKYLELTANCQFWQQVNEILNKTHAISVYYPQDDRDNKTWSKGYQREKYNSQVINI